MARDRLSTHADIAKIRSRFPEIIDGDNEIVFNQLCERFQCHISRTLFKSKHRRWALNKFAKDTNQDWGEILLQRMRKENGQQRHKRHRIKEEQLKTAARQFAKKLTRQWASEPPSRISAQPEHLNVIAGLPGTKFYKTPEWIRLRMQVLTVRGARCVLCGASRAHGVRLDVHHIEPRAMRPERSLDFDNLEVLCEPCHVGTHLSGATA